jgi:hypothetical protein
VTFSPDNADEVTGGGVIFNFNSRILICSHSMDGRMTPWIYVTPPFWSFLKHERRARISFSSTAFNSSSKAFLCSCKALQNFSTTIRDSSGNSSSFTMMMFLESISDKLPSPSAIVADESFFVPSGVAKKCVDVRSGHTLKHLFVHGPQMSLVSLWISRPVRLI